MDKPSTSATILISPEGKREFMSDEEIGGAGVDGRSNRAGIDRTRVEIGSS
jgi:hypothetical protein